MTDKEPPSSPFENSMDNKADDERLLVGISEASRIMGLGRTSVYELMAAGDLENLKIGNRRLITLTSIHLLIKRLLEKAA